jgi:hypothetical protein
MKLILLFVGFTVGAFIAALIAHLAMNTLRTVLLTVFVARRHDEAAKRLGDPRDRILEATRDATFDPGTPWFPSWLPLPLRAIWCAGGLVTVTVRYALRVWWPVLLLAAVLTAVYINGSTDQRAVARGAVEKPRELGYAQGPASGEPRSFKCTQPLPEFTLGPASNPSDAELAKLCACVWSKLPEGGWEREVSAKIRRGEDPGWRGRGFVPRFGAAIDACGGRSL